jgi:hypothetical protein
MASSEDLFPGAALASLFVLHTVLNVLISRQLIPGESMLELLDQTLLLAEKTQSNAAAEGKQALEIEARGARFHIQALRTGLEAFIHTKSTGSSHEPG